MELSSLIGGGVSLLISTIIVFWIRTVYSRSLKDQDARYKAIEDALRENKTSCSDCDETVRGMEKTMVRLEEDAKNKDKEIEQVRADLSRETQVMSNQIEIVHKKIDHIDAKIEKMRDQHQTIPRGPA